MLALIPYMYAINNQLIYILITLPHHLVQHKTKSTKWHNKIHSPQLVNKQIYCKHTTKYAHTHSHTMEDNVSIKSSDSVTTSGEYEIVSELLDCPATMEVAGKAAGNSRAAANADTDVGGIVKVPAKSPTLRIANNGDFTELEKNLHEVIHDEPDTIGAGGQTSSSAAAATVEVASIASDTKPVQDVPSAFSTGTLKLDEHVDSRMYLSKYCAQPSGRDVSRNVWVCRVFGYDGEPQSSTRLRGHVNILGQLWHI